MKVFFTIVLVLLFLPAFAQKTILATVEKDGKYGCINLKGKEVVPVVYDAIEIVGEGLIGVNIGEDGMRRGNGQSKWGFCDTNGKLVVDLIYNNINGFNEGLAPVLKDGLWGFIDNKGQMVIKPAFKSVNGFSEGLCGASQGDEKWGYINHQGEWVIKPIFDNVSKFQNGLSSVFVGQQAIGMQPMTGGYGLINKKGEFIAPPEFYSIGEFYEGFAGVAIPVVGQPEIMRYGFISTTGKLTVLEDFNITDGFHEGMALVRFLDSTKTNPNEEPFVNKCHFGYIDTSGKIILPKKYTIGSDFSGGYAEVSTTEQKKVIEFMWAHVGGSSMAHVGDKKIEEKDWPTFELIDQTGKNVLKDRYTMLLKIDISGLYIAEKTVDHMLREGVINNREETIFPFIFQNLNYLGSNYFSGFDSENLNVLMDIKGGVLFKSKDYRISDDAKYEFGLFRVESSEFTRFGFVDASGNLVIKPEYTTVGYFEDALKSK
jgi:hypothetical protein